MNNKQMSDAATADLERRKKVSRRYLRSLSPIEKIEKLFELQNQYYQMLVIREQNGGHEIPKKWRKWHDARSSATDKLLVS
jgi:hypothetical protein